MSTGTGQSLADFLLARCDEEEAAVRSLDSYGGSTGEPGRCKEHTRADGFDWIATDAWDDSYRLATTAARVLADCEARRRIVDLHATVPVAPGHRELTCLEDGSVVFPCPTLRLLALPYRSHPEFRSEWSVGEAQ